MKSCNTCGCTINVVSISPGSVSRSSASSSPSVSSRSIGSVASLSTKRTCSFTYTALANGHRLRPMTARSSQRRVSSMGSMRHRLAVKALAGLAPEGPALRATEVFAVAQRRAVAGAALLRMHLVVLAQHEGLLPFVEIEAVVARFPDQFAELARRQRADRALRMHADPVQPLVLDDVAHPGEDVLVEQGVGRERVGLHRELAARRARIPLVGHHVGGPVVGIVQVAFDVLHRAGIEVELAPARKPQAQARDAVLLARIDRVAAEQHEM